MSRTRHSEAEIIAALKQMEAEERRAEDVAREAGVSHVESAEKNHIPRRGAGSTGRCNTL